MKHDFDQGMPTQTQQRYAKKFISSRSPSPSH